MNTLTLKTLAAAQKASADEPRVQISVGLGTCGVAAGAQATFDAFTQELAAANVQDVTLRPSGCMGLCYSEPTVEVIVAGEAPVVYGNVDAAVAREIVTRHVIGGKLVKKNVFARPAADLVRPRADEPETKQQRIVLRNCGLINPERLEDYLARDGYAALAKALTDMTPEQVIDELRKSGLRGRGGAGFPTWMKWKFTKDAAGDGKYVVCNADEGDPGAYMDRSTIEGDPHSVLEAMAIAGRTVGATQGVVYIRAEYPVAIRHLQTAISQARAAGLLGEKILGTDFNFDVEVRLGAGAFVCGEETALLASAMGRRGMPIPRPPFPAVSGLWQKPTVINNVETYANIPMIILRGGEWFASVGTVKSPGTKVFALTGKINHSGLIEVPMGITLREIIYDIGGGIRDGKKFKAVQTGGPSGGVITAEYLDTPIDYEHLQELGSIMGSGGMIVMDEDDCMVDVARFYQDFCVDESCGKCAPCRVGTRTLLNLLDKITTGKGTRADLKKIRDVGAAMQKAALCGLGQTAPNPVLSTLKYFEAEYLAHIDEQHCPAGKCKALVTYSIDASKCIGCTLCARRCPVGAIEGERQKPHRILPEQCIKCGECLKACKFGAVSRR
ncbi:MAG: NADH-quinone oxidoreductase subunit NuoF [Kiritimatiellia bacterium]